MEYRNTTTLYTIYFEWNEDYQKSYTEGLEGFEVILRAFFFCDQSGNNYLASRLWAIGDDDWNLTPINKLPDKDDVHLDESLKHVIGEAADNLYRSIQDNYNPAQALQHQHLDYSMLKPGKILESSVHIGKRENGDLLFAVEDVAFEAYQLLRKQADHDQVREFALVIKHKADFDTPEKCLALADLYV